MFAYWLVIALLNAIPAVGAAISTLLLPAFSVSFMIACAAAERGERPALRMVAADRQRLSTLLAGRPVPDFDPVCTCRHCPRR